MHKAIMCVLGMACLGSVQAKAETNTEEVIRLSKLTLSAMECSHFSKEEEEANRLGLIGIEAGKKFLALMPRLSPQEQKSAGQNIAMLWRGVSGYSVDFVLGRVWQEMQRIAYDSLGNETKDWDAIKFKKYTEKNCMIIH